MVEQHYAPLAFVAFFAALLAFVIVVPASDWVTLSVYVVIFALAAVLLFKQGIRPMDPAFPVSLFFLAATTRLLGSIARLWTLIDVYDWRGDAVVYHNSGQRIAEYFRALDFSVLDWYRVGGEGTTNMVELTGVLYTFLPPNLSGSFIFFTGLAFAGSVLFYISVTMAYSDSSPIAYRFFVFFLPSILFWPSSLGKDAWIFFCSGVVALGWVLFVKGGKNSGLVVAGLGLLLVNFIRPHTAAFLGIAMGGSFLLYGTRQIRSALAWLMGGIVVAVLVGYLVQSGAEFLKLEEFSLDAVQDFYADQQERTTSGSSQYATVSVFTPSGAAIGLITALARPFPWEAHNTQALIAGLETVVWLGFCWLQRKVFLRKLRRLRSDPVAAFALIYSVIMLLALTSIGNFGLIARQRVAMLPFLWMLFV